MDKVSEMTTCSACQQRPATVSTGPTWFLCDKCHAASDAYDNANGLPRAIVVRLNSGAGTRRAALAKNSVGDADALGTTLYRMRRGLPLTAEQKRLARYFED